MKRPVAFAPILICSLVFAAAQSTTPLKLVARHDMPASAHGRFDHLGVDLEGNRLFLAAESMHCVLILNLRTGKYIGEIPNIDIPHAIFVRHDLNRIYITDGGTGKVGGVRVYDGTTYHQIAFIPLKRDTDSIAYDPQTKYLYVVNGGGDANETFSMYSVINTTSDTKLADIKVNGDTLEASVVDPSSLRIFVNNPAKNEVDVINRKTRTIEAVWPVHMATRNVAMALDARGHRLFLGCRSGKIVVLDSQTGKELQTLDIDKGVDDLIFDPATKRIYASCGAGQGSTYVYVEQNPDRYKLLAAVSTAPGAKNEVLVPQLDRYFTVVPPSGNPRGAVLEFAVEK
jgi:DNA-binding beta-propeller fold protein YncE